VVLVDPETGLLVDLADCGQAGRAEAVAVDALVVVDPAAGEDPGPAEGDLGVAPEHEHLEVAGRRIVPQEEDGGGRDQLGVVFDGHGTSP
jgi:hypothetical protein